MTTENVKIDLNKIKSKIKVYEEIIKELRQIKGKTQVSMQPGSDNAHVIIGGQKCQVDDFINKLKKEKLFLGLETKPAVKPFQTKEPLWVSSLGGPIRLGPLKIE